MKYQPYLKTNKQTKMFLEILKGVQDPQKHPIGANFKTAFEVHIDVLAACTLRPEVMRHFGGRDRVKVVRSESVRAGSAGQVQR